MPQSRGIHFLEDLMSRVRSNAVHKALETAEQEVGQGEERKISSQGKATLEPVRVEAPDKPVNAEWAAMMEFANQPITIELNESNEKNAENPVYCANNGDLAPVTPRPGWLYRGKQYTIPRKFLESLARAKVTTYTQREETDPAGVRHVINVPHTALRYHFRVIHDPHPRGGDWLKSLLLEP
jgi:hypothetical protein